MKGTVIRKEVRMAWGACRPCRASDTVEWGVNRRKER